MTILERIKIARESNEAWKDEDTLNKLIALAYEIGRESAAKEISDDYTELIADMRKRANACRYPHMANAIIGNKNYIHHYLYAGDTTETFGSDETNL